MPIYEPIKAGAAFPASASDLVDLRWGTHRLVAEFLIPGPVARVLRVGFDSECIVRILNEMPLSTEEEDSPDEGLKPDHFAYRVEGAAFARAQSEAWKQERGPVAHYRFITGGACLDVLSASAPTFSTTRW